MYVFVVALDYKLIQKGTDNQSEKSLEDWLGLNVGLN